MALLWEPYFWLLCGDSEVFMKSSCGFQGVSSGGMEKGREWRRQDGYRGGERTWKMGYARQESGQAVQDERLDRVSGIMSDSCKLPFHLTGHTSSLS